MVTTIEQLKKLIEKYGVNFNLQQAIELEKMAVTNNAK